MELSITGPIFLLTMELFRCFMGILLSRMPGVTPFLDDALIMGFSSTEVTGQHIKVCPSWLLVIFR